MAINPVNMVEQIAAVPASRRRSSCRRRYLMAGTVVEAVPGCYSGHHPAVAHTPHTPTGRVVLNDSEVLVRTLTIALLLAAACTTDTPGTDTDTDVGTLDDTHPLVPKEFAHLWNTEGGCSTEFGDGDQVYMIFDGKVDADGVLTGTEKLWWFYSGQEESADCVDTFSLSGVTIDSDPTCSSCEEFYDARRELVEDNCKSNSYAQIYRSDEDGYYQRLMFDTLNEINDQPNEDDKIGVFHQEKGWRNDDLVTKLYASERGSIIIPDGEAHSAPATYRWIGKRCQVGRRG